MPSHPPTLLTKADRIRQHPQHPYQHVAAALSEQILNGQSPNGAQLPPIPAVAADFNVSIGTAHRALELLAEWNLITVSSSRRAIVTYVPTAKPDGLPADDAYCPLPDPIPTPRTPERDQRTVERRLLHLNKPARTITTRLDPHNIDDLHRAWEKAVHRYGATSMNLTTTSSTLPARRLVDCSPAMHPDPSSRRH